MTNLGIQAPRHLGFSIMKRCRPMWRRLLRSAILPRAACSAPSSNAWAGHQGASFDVRLIPDVFIPDTVVVFDKLPHQIDTFGIIKDYDLDSVVPEKLLIASKVQVLAYDDSWDFELNDGSRAHHAGRKGRV
jgi:hypothetical protein